LNKEGWKQGVQSGCCAGLCRWRCAWPCPRHMSPAEGYTGQHKENAADQGLRVTTTISQRAWHLTWPCPGIFALQKIYKKIDRPASAELQQNSGLRITTVSQRATWPRHHHTCPAQGIGKQVFSSKGLRAVTQLSHAARTRLNGSRRNGLPTLSISLLYMWQQRCTCPHRVVCEGNCCVWTRSAVLPSHAPAICTCTSQLHMYQPHCCQCCLVCLEMLCSPCCV
jgi:hypothetical protein